MKPGQSTRLGARILLGLNLLMAFGTLWVFMRMTPAIEVILQQNQLSILASEEMLAALAMSPPSKADNQALLNTFRVALKRSQSNITEGEEPEALSTIDSHYRNAFAGDLQARTQTIKALARLSKVNRDAMHTADYKARQMGNAGAWGVVFMASLLFLVGMLFVRSMRKNLIDPLAEIYAVTLAVRNEDHMRRCTSTHESPKDIRVIFTELNELLDQYTAERLHQKIGQ